MQGTSRLACARQIQSVASEGLAGLRRQLQCTQLQFLESARTASSVVVVPTPTDPMGFLKSTRDFRAPSAAKEYTNEVRGGGHDPFFSSFLFFVFLLSFFPDSHFFLVFLLLTSVSSNLSNLSTFSFFFFCVCACVCVSLMYVRAYLAISCVSVDDNVRHIKSNIRYDNKTNQIK